MSDVCNSIAFATHSASPGFVEAESQAAAIGWRSTSDCPALPIAPAQIDWEVIQKWSAKLGGIRVTAIRGGKEIKILKGLNQAEIQHWQDEGYRVYYETNSCGSLKRNDANVERIREVGIDLDAKIGAPNSLEGLRQAIAALDLPQPTINQTKGGFHLHWLLEADSISPCDYKALADRIAAALPGGDPAVTSPSELLKVPGCWDVKDINKPFLIRTVQDGEVVGREFIDAALLLPAPSKAAKAAKPVKVAKPTTKSTDSAIASWIASSVTGKRDRLNEGGFIMGLKIHAGKASHDQAIELLIGALKSDAAVEASVECWELANTTAIEGIDAGLKAAETKQAGNAGRYPIPAKVARLLPLDDNGRPPRKLHPLDELEFLELQFEGRCKMNRRNLKIELDGRQFDEDALYCELMKDARRWGYRVSDPEKYVKALASQNRFDPWLDYWEALPLMPEDEIEPTAKAALGALCWPEDELSERYFYQFLLDFSRRIKHPGCSQRRTLVLLSEIEEIGKSAFFNNLSKMSWANTEDSFYTIVGGRPSNQFTEDAQLRTAVLRVLDELDAVTKKSDQAELKDWIARTHDPMKKIFSSELENVPRAGIMVATGNKKESLPPDDENSRFMVVELCRKFNWDWLNDGGFRKIQMLSKAIYHYGQTPGQHVDSREFNIFALNLEQQAQQIHRNRGHILSSGSEDEALRLANWIESAPQWFNAETAEHVGFTLEELLRFGCDQKNANKMQKSDLKRAFKSIGWEVVQQRVGDGKAYLLRKEGFRVWRAKPNDLGLLEGMLATRSI